MPVTTPAVGRRVLWVLFPGVLMGALDIAMVGPALPAIQAHFALDERAVAWVFALFVLCSLIGTPVMAKLSDTFGRRNVFIFDLLLFVAGALVVAFASGYGVFLVGRALQGLGVGGVFPVAGAVIGDVVPVERRGRTLGLIGAVFGVAFLIGPPLAVALMVTLDWTWIFLLSAPIGLTVVVLAIRLLPVSTVRGVRPPFDWAGMAVLALMLGALAFGVNQMDTRHMGAALTSVRVWPFLVLTAVLVPVFRRIENRAGNPIVRLRLFQSREVRIACALSVGSGFTEAALIFIPAFSVAAFGVSRAEAGLLMMPLVLALAIGSPTIGRVLDRVGARRIVVVGTALLTLGMTLMALWGMHKAVYYPATILIGLGLACVLGTSLNYILLNETPVEDRGTGQGLQSLFLGVGQLIGSAFIGALVTSQGSGIPGYRIAYGLIAGISLLLCFAALRLKRPAPREVAV